MANPPEKLIEEALSTARRAQRLRDRCKEYVAMHSEEPVPAVFKARAGQGADLMAAGLGISMAQKMVDVTRSLERNLRFFRKLCPNGFLRPPLLYDPEARVFTDLLRRATRTTPLANEDEEDAEDEGAMEAGGDRDLLLGATLFLCMGNMSEVLHLSEHGLFHAINDGLETCRIFDMAIRAMAAAYCQENLPVTERGEEARAVRVREMEAAAADVCGTAPRVLRVLQSWVAAMQDILDDVPGA